MKDRLRPAGPGDGRLAPSAGLAGGLAFILATGQYVIAQLVAASAWNPSYSWTTNYISDLGNTACGQFSLPHSEPTYVCSPDHALMNGSFVLGGVLTIAGTVLLWKLWPTRRMTTTGLLLLLIAGVLKIVVGLVPENVNVPLHVLGALNLPLESVAVLLLSVSVLGRDRALAIFGCIVAVVGLLGATLSSAAQYAGSALNVGLGNGGMERVAAYPSNAWLVVVGGSAFLVAGRRHASTAQAPGGEQHRERVTAARSPS